jgi:hypothetical protein
MTRRGLASSRMISLVSAREAGQALPVEVGVQDILGAYPGATVEFRPRTPIPPAPTWSPRPAVPRDWQDLDGWRRLLTYARLVENRRWVVSRWAKAAGGEVRDGSLHLPDDLSRGLALAELKTHARCVGLAIELPT